MNAKADPSASAPAVRSSWRTLVADRNARLGLAILVALLVLALLGQLLTALGLLEPDLVRLPDKLRPPLAVASGSLLKPDQLPAWGIYWLGTDEFGRSVLARVIAGAFVSLTVGLVSVAIASSIGLALGCVAGVWGRQRLGWLSLDSLIVGACDTVSCFPTFFLVLTIVALLPSSLWNIVCVIGLTSWMAPARLVRAEVRLLRSHDYVLAARALGLSELTILRRHILPGVLPPLVVSATLGVAFAVLTESAISFLGFGVQPPHATWGNILAGARPFLFDAPWLFVAPGMAIFALVLATYLLGDALRRRLEAQDAPAEREYLT